MIINDFGKKLGSGYKFAPIQGTKSFIGAYKIARQLNYNDR